MEHHNNSPHVNNCTGNKTINILLGRNKEDIGQMKRYLMEQNQ